MSYLFSVCEAEYSEPYSGLAIMPSPPVTAPRISPFNPVCCKPDRGSNNIPKNPESIVSIETEGVLVAINGEAGGLWGHKKVTDKRNTK